jgi:hypothetical protein
MQMINVTTNVLAVACSDGSGFALLPQSQFTTVISSNTVVSVDGYTGSVASNNCVVTCGYGSTLVVQGTYDAVGRATWCFEQGLIYGSMLAAFFMAWTGIRKMMELGDDRSD